MALTYAFQLIFFAGAMFLLNWHLTLTLLSWPHRHSCCCRARSPVGSKRVPRAAKTIRIDHRGGRGEPREHPSRAGVRPGRPRGGAVRRRKPGGLLGANARHSARGVVRAVQQHRRVHRRARRHGGRRLRARPRRDHPRRPARVPGLPEPALRARPGFRGPLEHAVRRVRGRRAHHRGARRAARRRRARAAARAGPRRRRDPLREGVVHLRRHRRPALRGVDLLLSPGRKVAIVGASGAGKSTFTKLLLRSYDPGQGRDHARRVDLRELSLTDLRRNISTVLQETLVFDGTVAENIRWGKPDATDAEVRAAAEPPTPTGSSRASTTATTRGSANAAGCSPAASASGWPSPAPSSATRRCCSWTSRPPGWTPRRGSGCSPRSAG